MNNAAKWEEFVKWWVWYWEWIPKDIVVAQINEKIEELRREKNAN